MKPLNHNEIFGNWATLLLTTNDKGEIDYSMMNDEIDVLIASNPNGIYSNGTAGEFYSQTEKEFYEISELLALKCEKSNVPFQIGVSHMSPQISLERLKAIKHLNPGAVQLILPDWFPVTIEESINFLKKMEENADGISLILYNPPHAKKVLTPNEWTILKDNIPSLEGVKVFDHNWDETWYKSMNKNNKELSVFIPGHNLATGFKMGAHGAYSNVACLNPFIAQKWYNQMIIDIDAAVELEKRIHKFMNDFISPFIVEKKFPNHACDRLLALIGNWSPVGVKLRWPYNSIPTSNVEFLRKKAINIIPEFFHLKIQNI